MCFDRQTINLLARVNVFGITLDKNINFKWHMQNICHKANKEIKALFLVSAFLNLEQA